MIQMSSATADLIAMSNKGEWLTPREGKINCKGKGMMQTYWFEAKQSNQSKRTRRMSISTAFNEFVATESSLNISLHSSSKASNPPDRDTGTLPRKLLKHQHSILWGTTGKFGSIDSFDPPPLCRHSSDATARLIDWNADVLLRLLKHVVRIPKLKVLSLPYDLMVLLYSRTLTRLPIAAQMKNPAHRVKTFQRRRPIQWCLWQSSLSTLRTKR